MRELRLLRGRMLGSALFPSLFSSSASGQQEPFLTSALRLCFIDAGLAVRLGAEDQRNLLALFRAVALNDGELAGQLLVEKSRAPETVRDRAGFVREIAKVVQEVHAAGLSLGTTSVGALLNQVLALCYRHQVKIESRYACILGAMGVVEGIGRQLDPNIDILSEAWPFILRASAKLLMQ
jgi:aarF domain-containing kinase